MKAVEPLKVNITKPKERQEKNHGYEPAETWRELLDTARRATCLDKAEEFYDGTVTKPQPGKDTHMRFYDPGAGRRTAETILDKLDQATRTHVQGGELPFTERTASELTTYIQSQAPQLGERHNATLRIILDKLIPWSKDKKYRGGFLATLTELCTTTTAITRAQYIRSTAAAVVRILGSTDDSNAQALRACRHSLAQIQRVGKEEAITAVITTIEDGLQSASPLKFDEKARFILLGFITATDWCDAMTPDGLQTADEKASALSNGDQSTTRVEWRTTEAEQASIASPIEKARTAAREQWIRVKNALKPTTDSPSGIIDWRTVSTRTSGQIIENVVFWNVDGLAKRIDEVLHVLIHRRPCVLVLTEIKGDDSSLRRLGPEKDLRTTLRELGYDCVVASTCALESIGPGNYGVMIISRVAPTSISFGFGDATDKEHEDVSREGRVLTARFANSNVTIVGAYAPCSRIGIVPRRRSLFDRLMKNHLVKEARDTHLLYMADANVAPEEHDADTSKMAQEDIEKMPSCMPAERQAYRALLQETDMVDVYRETHPTAHTDDFTWHTRSPTNLHFPLGMRIDMAMCTRADYDNKFIKSCEVLRYGTSDHSGLMVRLNKQQHQVPAVDAENALEVDPSVFPDTTPLTDYGDIITPLVFEQLLAIRWGFEPTSDLVTRLKEEMEKSTEDTGRRETLQEIRQRETVKQALEPTCVYGETTDYGHVGPFEEHRQSGYGHEVGGPNDPNTKDPDRELPHKLPWDRLRHDCPILRTKFPSKTEGGGARVTHCLADTGAKSNIITLDLLEKCKYKRLPVQDGAKPYFIMADGSRTQPLRRVQLDFSICDDHDNDAWFTEQFWVMRTGCVEVILGAEFLKNKGAVINFGEGTVNVTGRASLERTNFTSTATQGSYFAVMAATEEEAIPMICTRTTRILPGYHHRVPVRPNAPERRDLEGQWGTLQPVDEESRFLTACGPTKLGQWTHKSTTNWVQISNPTPETVIITQGTIVAAFHRGNETSYDIVDWDVDVEERLLEHLQKEVLEKGTETAARDYRNQLDSIEAQKESVAAIQTDSRDNAEGIPTATKPRLEETQQERETGQATAEELHRAFTDEDSPLSSISFGDKINANPVYLEQIRQLVYKYRHLWRKPSFTSGETDVPTELHCKIVTETPFVGRPRMHSTNAAIREVIRKEVDSQRKAGIIEPSASPFASSILLVPKKDGTTRFCIDYRALNACTRRDGYVMPRVDDSLSALLGSQYFTSLDLTAAFNQIPIVPEHRDLTSFSSPDGTWRYTRMPFGLINGPAIFTRFIDTVLAGLKWSVCMVYMDDILVYSPTFEKHLAGLEQVFSRMHDFGLTFKAKKCFIGNEEVKFLGHVVSTNGVKPDPDKTKAIKEMPIPEDKDQMRSAVGLFGYYRRFCKNFSQVANPLTKTLRKSSKRMTYTTDPVTRRRKANWTGEQLEAFEKLRTMLVEGAVLAHPDWGIPFTVHTDACKHGIGAALVQIIDKVERVVSFVSRTLTETEMNYNIYEKECLAIIWSCELWYTLYLYGRKFNVVTDNQALTWLFGKTHKTPISSRLSKWIIRMQDLDFTTTHRKGSMHCNADGLSRNPLKSTAPYGEKSSEDLYGMAPPIMCAAQCACATQEESEDRRGWKQINKEAFDTNKQYHAACLDFRIHGQDASCTYFGTQDKEAETNEEWRELQRADETCLNLITTLEETAEPSSARATKLRELYVMKDGILYKLPESKKKPAAKQTEALSPEDALQRCILCTRPQRQQRYFDDSRPKTVVPESLKAFILYRHHGLPIAGHDGRKRVFANLRERFYWKGMYVDTKRWIRACTTCARRKTPRPMRAGVPQTILPRAPGDWSVDVQGPLPLTKDGNRYLLTMLDCFLHWSIAVPIPDTKASTISRAIFRHILCNHGRPRVILTDRGKELIGNAVAHLCKRWGIRKIATTGEQPQSNPVERFHRYLNTSMTALHGSFGLDWDHYVDAAVFTYRVSYCEASGHSPFYMLYGREAVKPQDILLGEGPRKEFESEEAYATHTCTALAVAYREAYEEQAARAHHNVEYRRKFMSQTNFAPGQKVHYWQAGASDKQQLEETKQQEDDDTDLTTNNDGHALHLPKKWKYRWTGPHTVLGKSTTTAETDMGDSIIPNNYDVRHCTTGATFRANVNRLTKFHKWSESILSTSPTSVSREGFQTTGRPEIGSLLIAPFAEEQEDNAPIMLGKLLSRNEETGHLVFQWMWNRAGHMRQPMHLGWNNPKGGWSWTQPKGKGANKFTPFTNMQDEGTMEITDNQVICHSFKLKQGYLPVSVIQFLVDHEQVPWDIAKWGGAEERLE